MFSHYEKKALGEKINELTSCSQVDVEYIEEKDVCKNLIKRRIDIRIQRTNNVVTQ